ncbi:MAG: nicotinamide riboside transporter PnuC [Bacteroidota bacterium]|nr:nicotinamide riboside transporter PnuC [Bacteroidota bacterium]
MSEITLVLTNLEFNWSMLETIAVLFSIIYVILGAKENIWCWAFAAISVALYIYICLNARLLSETGLQVFYLFMAAYGYYNWNKSDTELEIQQWSVTKHLLLILFGAIAVFLTGFYFSIYTNAKMPIVDSFTTVFSIIATYMITKKVLENWLYWIIIDIVSIYLYFNRDLHLTSLLFMLYTIIAIFGYFAWLNKIKKDV